MARPTWVPLLPNCAFGQISHDDIRSRHQRRSKGSSFRLSRRISNAAAHKQNQREGEATQDPLHDSGGAI